MWFLERDKTKPTHRADHHQVLTVEVMEQRVALTGLQGVFEPPIVARGTRPHLPTNPRVGED